MIKCICLHRFNGLRTFQVFDNEKNNITKDTYSRLKETIKDKNVYDNVYKFGDVNYLLFRYDRYEKIITTDIAMRTIKKMITALLKDTVKVITSYTFDKEKAE